jgi:hypothetical protein
MNRTGKLVRSVTLAHTSLRIAPIATPILACLIPSIAIAQAPAASQPQPTTSPAMTNVAATTASASTAEPSAPQTPPAPEKPESSCPASFQLNFDYTNAYFYRGIRQEDSGLILQPAAKLTLNLHDADDFKLDTFFGTWNSFHGRRTGSAEGSDFNSYWYESDIYAGLTVTSGKISLSASYTFLTSPNNGFETVQELGFSLALDDSEWLKKWSLKPYATIAIETGADASDGADSDTGVYLELGIAPGFSIDIGTTPVAISFPASIGLSISNYYQDPAGNDSTFGFLQFGAKASIPLGEPGRCGAWTLNAGASALLLGNHTKDYNRGNSAELVATLGLQWNF